MNHARLENTRASVLEEIRKFITAADNWIEGLTNFSQAEERVIRARREQTDHDEILKAVYANPKGWDVGELEAHTRRLDMAAIKAEEQIQVMAAALDELTSSLRLAAPPCEIVAPGSVAKCVEDFATKAVRTNETIKNNYWADLDEAGGITGQPQFNSMRFDITAATRRWNHPEGETATTIPLTGPRWFVGANGILTHRSRAEEVVRFMTMTRPVEVPSDRRIGVGDVRQTRVDVLVRRT